MSVKRLELYNPGDWYYSMHDKLFGHIVSRSEECFKRAQEKRSQISTKEELKLYSDEKREDFIKNIGGIPYDKSFPLNAQITGIIEEEDITIENVIFESRPNVYVTANLYIPKKRKKPCGAVLFQIGHSVEGKFALRPQRVARAIALSGLVVLAMDPTGQGERLNYYEPELNQTIIPAATKDHQYAGDQCLLLGDNIARYFIADAMRAIDYLETRPEVDKEKIGATGSSGGGTATCYMMLCDDRIKAAAPGTFVTTRQAYLYAGGAQDAEQIWFNATQNGFDHHEFILSFAPKPLLLLTVDTDFFPIEGAEEVFSIGKRFYAMYDAEEKINKVMDKSCHAYTEMLAIEAGKFFAKELNGEDVNIDTKKLKNLPNKELTCTKNGQVKGSIDGAKIIFDENLERFKNIKAPEMSLKEFLEERMQYQRKEEELRLRTFGSYFEPGLKVTPYVWFAQSKMPNFGLQFTDVFDTLKDIEICLWDSGTDRLEEYIYEIRKIVENKRAAFVIDLSGVGKGLPHSLDTNNYEKEFYGILDKLAKDLLFLGDSLCALRLFELRYAVRMLRDKFGGRVSINASGVSSAYAALYKVIEPDMEINIKNGISDYRKLIESKYYENYNISGILLPGIAQYL